MKKLLLLAALCGCVAKESKTPPKTAIQPKTYRYRIEHRYFGDSYGASSAYMTTYYTDTVNYCEGTVVNFRPFNGNEKLSIMGSVIVKEDIRSDYGYSPPGD